MTILGGAIKFVAKIWRRAVPASAHATAAMVAGGILMLVLQGPHPTIIHLPPALPPSTASTHREVTCAAPRWVVVLDHWHSFQNHLQRLVLWIRGSFRIPSTLETRPQPIHAKPAEPSARIYGPFYPHQSKALHARCLQ